jgi:hypothetical protein
VLLIICWPCRFVLQSEVEKLSLEEQRLDDKIRLYGCFALQQEGIFTIFILLANAFKLLLYYKQGNARKAEKFE